ncbi:MAG TPA: glutathione S-transferase family protein [Myxococcaceae bacterium]|nr:glutathione S-transferase family protein [Myxococcaceae bacterium]
MKLFGTTTSPFARRVRVVAQELGVPFELISTATPEGESTLRQLAPLWKLPVAVFPEPGGERVVWDSRAIIDYLVSVHGLGPFRPAASGDPWLESNLVNAIDGALEAAINVFYLEREGLPADRAAYLTKQVGRTDSALRWVEAQLRGSFFFADARMGMAELALATTLDWLLFRKRYSVEQHPGLAAFMRVHAKRPSLKDTYPH